MVNLLLYFTTHSPCMSSDCRFVHFFCLFYIPRSNRQYLTPSSSLVFFVYRSSCLSFLKFGSENSGACNFRCFDNDEGSLLCLRERGESDPLALLRRERNKLSLSCLLGGEYANKQPSWNKAFTFRPLRRRCGLEGEDMGLPSNSSLNSSSPYKSPITPSSLDICGSDRK